ncbi:reverse transcriptase protein [Rhizobium sp. N541]|uniref:reverse transcriptase domain-containing protein n=1 Tax=unclassified Rhizobium TaxID=2613769 RepID=UPI0007EE401E|nr:MULTISPECIES: reverse transcriptase domain-containing protein [unclassified Rhizobium]ANM16330.1 reverse transcriptase protein [Rhizobium sp. N541]ANM22715.1 reverse transcriptase protein [Rhizobium sp. N941]
MLLVIEKAIEDEAKKRLARYSQAQYYKHKNAHTFTKRTGIVAKIKPHTLPDAWAFHKHFDPRYCLNHAKFLARGLWNSLTAGDYEPQEALRRTFPKPSGGERIIDAFSIPDAAVAKIFAKNLIRRNGKAFSDASYAYQEGKTNLDAVLRLRGMIEGETIFVSQYDFTKFFDSIEHGYLTRCFSKGGDFLTTKMERTVLTAVMNHAWRDLSGNSGTRTVGIPQGNSISLFLANAAAHSLDRDLGKLSGSFARFADDSVVINLSYEDALKTSEAYARFSARSGVKINKVKSTGIRIFSAVACEMAHIPSFTFLSYKFTPDGLSISDKSVANIKRRCTKIIYNNLLLHLRRTGKLASGRRGKGFVDWDLVTCVNELRRYIYGAKRQAAIDAFLTGGGGIGRSTGAVGYFGLLENGEKFQELDGWLLYVLRAMYLRRLALLPKKGKALSEAKILSGNWYKFPKVPMETSLPSFHTAWRAARKNFAKHGLGGVDPTGEGYGYE